MARFTLLLFALASLLAVTTLADPVPAAPQLTEQQKNDLAILFAVNDKNSDRKITADELKQTEAGQGKTTEEVEEMIKKYESNGNGAIDFDKFFVMKAPKNAEEKVQLLKDSFHNFDKNHDGFLDDEDLKVLFKTIGKESSDEYIRNWIEQADKDNDGQLSEAEFVARFQEEHDPAAPQLTEEQEKSLAILAILFIVYDKNGDGKITADELKQTLEELGRGKTTEEVGEMMKKYDRNGKGAIDFNDFFVMMAPKDAEEEVQHLKDSFHYFDKNRDGFLDIEDLKLLFKTIGKESSDEYIRNWFEQADKDNDGQLSEAEFVARFQEEHDPAAPQFTEEQERSLAILAILFIVYDKDGDLKITADELKQTLEELGRGKTTEEVEEMMRKYDRNGKGAIDFYDFFVMMAPKSAEEEVQHLKDSFHYFDKNRDGFLDVEEVKFFFESTKAEASDDDIRKWIEKADKDNDGRLSEAEFVAIFHDGKLSYVDNKQV